MRQTRSAMFSTGTHGGRAALELAHAVATTLVYTAATRRLPAGKARVDMSKYAYSAGVCPNGTSAFSGLIITYTEPA